MDDEPVEISPEMRAAIYRHGQVTDRLKSITTELDAMANRRPVEAEASVLFGDARDLLHSAADSLSRNEMDGAERLTDFAEALIERLRRGER